MHWIGERTGLTGLEDHDLTQDRFLIFGLALVLMMLAAAGRSVPQRAAQGGDAAGDRRDRGSGIPVDVRRAAKHDAALRRAMHDAQPPHAAAAEADPGRARHHQALRRPGRGRQRRPGHSPRRDRWA